MVVVPAGEFMMGSRRSEAGDETPVHQVTIRQAVRGRQVRGDVCGMGCVRGGRRL